MLYSSPYEAARRRAAECVRRERRARRVLATLVTLDGALLFTMLVVLLLFTFRENHALVMVIHLLHVFTLLLGASAVYHTAYAYDVLRWLMLTALIALVGDLCVVLVRVVTLMQTDVDDDALGWSTQRGCLLLAGAFIVGVDVPLAYFADELRAATILPLDGSGRRSAIFDTPYKSQQF
jgi:hypothetical protein